MHGSPAGLPSGMPGIGLVIEGAMQQAAQLGRQERVMVAIETDHPNARKLDGDLGKS